MSEDIRKNFASDNVTPVCSEVMEALSRVNHGGVPSYGEDTFSKTLKTRFAEVFEAEVEVFPVATGTAANSLALSAMVAPHGSILCDQSAHINSDEGGAPEFFTHGAKLVGIPSAQGQMDPATLPSTLVQNAEKGILAPPFQALSLTQATEWGTTYSCDALSQLSSTAHEHGLTVHLDGARLGNAIAHLGCSPAETTWKAGVDVLSFGGTKAGAMAAEAVVFFLNDRTRPLLKAMPHLRKRSGHTWSKHRFLSAQLLALLDNELWLTNAHHANMMSQRLVQALKRHPAAHLPFATESNEVFAVLPHPLLQELHDEGYHFYHYPTPEGVPGQLVRFVTSFYTRPDDIDALIDSLTA
ncbi:MULTISPECIES: beta-eliminating lyase-related protein [unclassified Saccharibacter]|uniref:threonine aldolase family protein n=1 Tax=unclassified Saccharibacter TaxID=2648722 RepID=UPI001321AB19|nr:low specificity L-threonine aldolase [Saccharibacter sp. EH611]MXV57296.1 low specificity L-threonine aldolase [Saccharibacter sp. EH70]MXV64843.1 low specificity L-threonine aldolase [Saccharibacter sp. EH60]